MQPSLFESANLDEQEIWMLVWLWRMGGIAPIDPCHAVALSLYDHVLTGTVDYEDGTRGIGLLPPGEARAQTEWQLAQNRSRARARSY